MGCYWPRGRFANTLELMLAKTNCSNKWFCSAKWNWTWCHRETREFDGRQYIMERALKADFAFVKAWKGDKWGNLVYRKTARNFNPMMATAAKVTIAEVEHLVEVGELEADLVHTPSVYVNRIFQGAVYEKRIEKRTTKKAS